MTAKMIILLCSIAIARAGQIAGKAATYGSVAPNLGYNGSPAAVSGYSINVAHGNISPYNAASLLGRGVDALASPISPYAASHLVHGASPLSGHLAHNSIAPYAASTLAHGVAPAYPYGASSVLSHGAHHAGSPLAYGGAPFASGYAGSGFPLASSNLFAPYSASHFRAPGFQAYGTPYSAPHYLPPVNNVLPYNAGIHGGVPLPYNGHACL